VTSLRQWVWSVQGLLRRVARQNFTAVWNKRNGAIFRTGQDSKRSKGASNKRSGLIYCSDACSSNLKLEEMWPYKISVNFYQTTRRSTPEASPTFYRLLLFTVYDGDGTNALLYLTSALDAAIPIRYTGAASVSPRPTGDEHLTNHNDTGNGRYRQGKVVPAINWLSRGTR
jgi:hypothetical protein